MQVDLPEKLLAPKRVEVVEGDHFRKRIGNELRTFSLRALRDYLRGG